MVIFDKSSDQLYWIILHTLQFFCKIIFKAIYYAIYSQVLSYEGVVVLAAYTFYDGRPNMLSRSPMYKCSVADHLIYLVS